jgi:hypothetical protein
VPDPEPLGEEELSRQAGLGPQSLRGGVQADDATFGPAIAGDAHARRCFKWMLENERKHSAGFSVFYHSYSDAAIVYELQAAVAAVLFRFRSDKASLPRLLRGRFAEVPDAPTMLKVFPTWPDQDHNPCFKSVGLCATTSLLAHDAEAPPKTVFLAGYSMGCPAAKLVEDLLCSCGVHRSKAKACAPKVIELAERSGLKTAAGGRGDPGSRPGHLLQIFIKRHLVNKYVYASVPMGVPDKARMPLDRHLGGRGPIQGQVRMVVHPSAFLRSFKVHMYTFSANEKFHKGRAEFQEQLTAMLGVILGDGEKRETAARGIFGGSLPSWWTTEDQREVVKTAKEEAKKASDEGRYGRDGAWYSAKQWAEWSPARKADGDDSPGDGDAATLADAAPSTGKRAKEEAQQTSAQVAKGWHGRDGVWHSAKQWAEWNPEEADGGDPPSDGGAATLAGATSSDCSKAALRLEGA